MAVIRYLVSDVDVAVAFYTSVLGFELVEKWGPPFAMVKRGDLTLWFQRSRAVLPRVHFPMGPEPCRAAGMDWVLGDRRSRVTGGKADAIWRALSQ